MNHVKRVLKGIIFDFDGTLGPFSVDLVEVRQALAKKHEELVGYRLAFSPYLVTIDRHVHDPQVKDALFEVIEKIEARYIEQFKPFAEVFRKIQEFQRAGLTRFAIFANNAETVIHQCLEKHGTDDLFEPVIGLRLATEHKPSPQALYAIVDQWKIAPSEAMYVGDTTPDAHAAARAILQYFDVRDFINLNPDEFKIS